MEEILQKIEYSDHRQEIFDGALSLLCNLSNINIRFQELIITLNNQHCRNQKEIIRQVHSLKRQSPKCARLYYQQNRIWEELAQSPFLSQDRLISRLYSRLTQKINRKLTLYYGHQRYLRCIQVSNHQIMRIYQIINHSQTLIDFYLFSQMLEVILKQNETLYQYIVQLIIQKNFVASIQQFHLLNDYVQPKNLQSDNSDYKIQWKGRKRRTKMSLNRHSSKVKDNDHDSTNKALRKISNKKKSSFMDKLRSIQRTSLANKSIQSDNNQTKNTKIISPKYTINQSHHSQINTSKQQSKIPEKIKLPDASSSHNLTTNNSSKILESKYSRPPKSSFSKHKTFQHKRTYKGSTLSTQPQETQKQNNDTQSAERIRCMANLLSDITDTCQAKQLRIVGVNQNTEHLPKHMSKLLKVKVIKADNKLEDDIQQRIQQVFQNNHPEDVQHNTKRRIWRAEQRRWKCRSSEHMQYQPNRYRIGNAKAFINTLKIHQNDIIIPPIKKASTFLSFGIYSSIQSNSPLKTPSIISNLNLKSSIISKSQSRHIWQPRVQIYCPRQLKILG